MLADLFKHAPSISRVMDVLVTYKKLILTSGVDTPDRQLQKELERLAVSAPHMLADIGFERDLKTSSSEQAVWRRGTRCVIVFSPKHAVAFP